MRFRPTCLFVTFVLFVGCSSSSLTPDDPGKSFTAEALQLGPLLQITRPLSGVIIADVSPMGNQVLLALSGSEGACGLRLLDLSDGILTLIDEGRLRSPYEARFSPDGSKIAYASSATCEPTEPSEEPSNSRFWPAVGLKIFDLANDQRITLYEGFAPELRAWLSNGDLLLERVAPATDLRTFWIESPDGRQKMAPGVELPPNVSPLVPDSVSPDGSKLLHIRDAGLASAFAGMDAVVINLATGERLDVPKLGMSPLWSSDGAKLAYLSSFTISDRQARRYLVVFEIDAGNIYEILETSSRESLIWPGAWSPDGQVLLLFSWERDRLLIINSDGTSLRDLYSELPEFNNLAGDGASTSQSVRERKFESEGSSNRYATAFWSPGGDYVYVMKAVSQKPDDLPEISKYVLMAAVVKVPGEAENIFHERASRLAAGPWPLALDA